MLAFRVWSQKIHLGRLKYVINIFKQKLKNINLRVDKIGTFLLANLLNKNKSEYYSELK